MGLRYVHQSHLPVPDTETGCDKTSLGQYLEQKAWAEGSRKLRLKAYSFETGITVLCRLRDSGNCSHLAIRQHQQLVITA